jgi:hypothetical protein
MPTTYVDYTATAAQTDFAFTFPYLEDEHVIVEIDGSPISSSLFSLVTSPSTKIVLNSGATAGQIVRVRRKSQPGVDLVDFENGSVLTESELDRAYLHNRYLNEEIGELNDASLQKEVGGTDWDAGGSKIKNVGAPTLTADATTKQYVDDKVNQLSSGASAPPTKWVFTGDAGANTTYSVTGAEVNGDTAYDVSVDGSVLEPTTDYTVDPDTDTLTIVNTLSGGEDIVVIERGFGVAITGTIGEDQLQSNAVTNSKIADDAVDTDQLADHSVTAVKISNTDSKFNVQTNGNVGIGTSAPSDELHINTIGVNPNLRLSRSTSTGVRLIGTDGDLNPAFIVETIESGAETERMRIDSDGNLHVNGTIEFGDGHTIGNGANDNLHITSSSGENIIIQARGGVNAFWGQTSEHMRIDSDGLVGIGTTYPSAPLEVVSTTGGVVFPRLTTTQRDAIGSPTDGETIFNTTTNQLESYNGTSWAAAGAVSKYSTGWVNTDGSTSVANAALLTFTHNLGTTDFSVTVYAGDDSSGTNPYIVSPTDASSNSYGAQVKAISTTQLSVQLAVNGFVGLNVSGAASGISWASKYIKVVAIG